MFKSFFNGAKFDAYKIPDLNGKVILITGGPSSLPPFPHLTNTPQATSDSAAKP